MKRNFLNLVKVIILKFIAYNILREILHGFSWGSETILIKNIKKRKINKIGKN